MPNKTLDLGDVAELQAALSVEQLDLFLNGSIEQRQAAIQYYINETKSRTIHGLDASELAFVLLMYLKSQQVLGHLCEELHRVAEDAEEELGEDEDEEEDIEDQ